MMDEDEDLSEMNVRSFSQLNGKGSGNQAKGNRSIRIMMRQSNTNTLKDGKWHDFVNTVTITPELLEVGKCPKCNTEVQLQNITSLQTGHPA